jgi:hypothetical protein
MNKKIMEFGSDFHYLTFSHVEDERQYPHFNKSHFYANGRHALQDLITTKLKKREWERIWMPEYFCYDVVRSILETGIDVIFYPDSPLKNDDEIISKLRFKSGDVLLRMNFFGLRTKRNSDNLQVQVIEDHSHDLTSSWALESNADYCIASLRKSLPVPEGGILWSPKHDISEFEIKSSLTDNEKISYKKLSAMLMKRLYLDQYEIEKLVFRKLMIDFEHELDRLPVSGISPIAFEIFRGLPVSQIQNAKKENWILLSSILKNGNLMILKPQNLSLGTPFSMIIILNDENEREKIKNSMLRNHIYPAVLWSIPDSSTKDNFSLGKRLLSIHCDIRYNRKDIINLGEKIVEIIKNDL